MLLTSFSISNHRDASIHFFLSHRTIVPPNRSESDWVSKSYIHIIVADSYLIRRLVKDGNDVASRMNEDAPKVISETLLVLEMSREVRNKHCLPKHVKASSEICPVSWELCMAI